LAVIGLPLDHLSPVFSGIVYVLPPSLGTGAALGLVWGLVRGSSAGWASPEVAGALAALTLAEEGRAAKGQLASLEARLAADPADEQLAVHTENRGA